MGKTDAELLSAWRGGQRKAGHELFTRYFESIHRFFRNKIDHEVEDLVQRTFMACVEGRERFEERSTFRTYLYGIARILLLEHYRAKVRGGRMLDADEHSIHDLGAGPSTVVAAKQEQRLLLQALRHIPLEHQILLELYFWEQLPAPRIAEIFDVPENTIRSRIRRGKQLLNLEIEELAGAGKLLDSTRDGLEGWAKSLRELVNE